MWIIKVALNRPYTFIVLALLILLLSPVVILTTPTDIFPNIDIPVVAVGWVFTGLSPQELEGRLTSVYERLVTATVDNIQHIESNTVNGRGSLSASCRRAPPLRSPTPRLRLRRRTFCVICLRAPCPRSSSVTALQPAG